MSTITADREELKKIIREACEDVLTDRSDLIEDAVIEAIEDIGMGRAIEEGKKKDYIDKEEFMKKLNVSLRPKK